MQTQPKRKTTKAEWIAAILIGVALASWALQGGNNMTAKTEPPADQAQQQQQEAASAAQARDKEVTDLSAAYCANHKTFKMQAFDGWADKGWPVFVGTRAWTPEECKAIMTKLYDSDAGRAHVRLVAEGKYAVGMSMHELIYAIGAPNDINSTVFAGGTNAQLVYGDPLDGAVYIYLTDGFVSAYQQ